MSRKQKGSKTLTALARALGVQVRSPVAFSPTTGEFISALARQKETEAFERIVLSWLLDVLQRTEITPEDCARAEALAGYYLAESAEQSISEAECAAFMQTLRGSLRDYFRNGREWRFRSNMEVVLRPDQPRRFVVRDWRIAANLKIAELLEGYGSDVRVCPECGRVFLGYGKQRYCNRKCSDLKRLHAYREKVRKAREMVTV
jgi:hypothetical protein